MTPSAPSTAAARSGADRATAGAVRPVDVDIAARSLRFRLTTDPRAAGQARRMTRAWLTAREVGEETCDSAALVVSELVTNALVHTSSREVECEITTDGVGKVRIAVADEGCTSGAPACRSVEHDGEDHGRGLLLVSAICSDWGAQERGPGLLVWAELPRTAVRRTGIEADDVRGTGAEWVS